MQREKPKGWPPASPELVAARMASNSESSVEMYEGKYSDGRELHTKYLAGCVATVAYIEYNDGRKAGILMHYPNYFWAKSLVRFCELTKDIKRGDVAKCDVVMLVPDGLAYRFKEGEANMVAIGAIAESTFGSKAKVRIMEYAVADSPGMEVRLKPGDSEFQTTQHGTVKF